MNRRTGPPDDFAFRYPTTRSLLLANEYGVTRSTIQKWARNLGLRKTPEHRSQVQRDGATGKSKSPETRAKIAAKHFGLGWTEEQRVKMQLRTMPSGPDHYKWKGGKPWRRFADERYQTWRTAVLEHDGYVCADCGTQRRPYEKGLAAHHVRSYAEYPDLRYDTGNGVTLCRRCHMARHGRALRPAEQIACACGCGSKIDAIDRYGRPRQFVNYHANRANRTSRTA